MNQKSKKSITDFLLKKTVIIPLALVIAFLCIAASLSSINTFVVYEGDNTTVFNSTIKNTADALSEAGITIDETKYAEMPEEAEHGIAKIYIYNKKKINLKIADVVTVLYSKSEIPLSELLLENGITLNPDDIVSVPVESTITDGLEVEIIRVTKKTEEIQTVLPYSTEKRPSSSLTKGVTKTVQKGVNGSKKTVYEVEYHNGKEVNRKIISETTTLQPVSQIIEYGTKPIDTSGTIKSRSGETLNYKRKISMTATAYTTERSSDKITATGKVARKGLVAVDPKVIPLGSKLYIVSADGKSWCYGTAVAADTGVRGNKIDLFFDTYKECIRFGRRKATVYVLK